MRPMKFVFGGILAFLLFIGFQNCAPMGSESQSGVVAPSDESDEAVLDIILEDQ